jgi:hypothetical protein
MATKKDSAYTTPCTTRLEILSLEPGRVVLGMDGHNESISGPAAVGAVHELNRAALAELAAHQGPAAAPGWFARLGTWLSSLFGRGPAHQAQPGLPTQAPPPAAPAPKSPPGTPSVFADREGVHLVWRPATVGKDDPPVSFTCRLDSEVADRLQECYGQLAKLGFKVTGLDVLHPGPSKTAPKEAERKTPAAEVPAAEAPAKAAGRRDRPVVMDLSHSPSPEKSREGRLLTGPDELVAAIRAGADPARPSVERLTHLRGTMAKGGFRIAEVGLGEDGETGPARWEAFETWMVREAAPQARPSAEPDPGP